MIETKHVELKGSPQGEKYYRKMYEECMNYIDDLKAFRWQETQVVTERNGRASTRYQIMARDTTIANYNEYRKQEIEYEDAKSNIKIYNKMEFSTLLLLFLILIIPCIVYVTIKMIQKNSIKNNNEVCRARMKKAVELARNIR
ncbi:MAG: hypothetical protein J6Y28_00060 [Acholeplasmatales bacterium]|nr:hypothetical protein [Acholeplasmatales bacterium]